MAQRGVKIGDGTAGFEVALKMAWGKRGVADERGELLPGRRVLSAGVGQGDALLAGFDPGLEQVGLVRGADVQQFIRRLDGVFGNGEEVRLHVEEALHRQQLVKADADAVENSVPLGEGLGFRLRNLLRTFRPVESQFAAGDNRLVDEKALHFAGAAGRTDEVALVADGRVGVQARLDGPTTGRLDPCGGLSEGGVALNSQLFQFGKG